MQVSGQQGTTSRLSLRLCRPSHRTFPPTWWETGVLIGAVLKGACPSDKT